VSLSRDFGSDLSPCERSPPRRGIHLQSQADTFAGAIAGDVKAKRLSCSRVPGRARHVDVAAQGSSPPTRPSKMIADGTIPAGMIRRSRPASMRSKPGVEGVVILDVKCAPVLLELPPTTAQGTLMRL